MQQDNSLIHAYLGILFKGIGRLVELKFKNGKTAVGIFGGLNHATMELLVRNMCFENAERNDSKSVIPFSDLEFFVVKHSSSTEPMQQTRSFKPLKTESHLTKAKSTTSGKTLLEKGSERPRGIQNDVFRTDTEIAKRTSDGRESKRDQGKVFKRFQGMEILNGHLLEDEQLDGFDQFSANKLHFGIESKFNENDYTTELDISKLTKHQIQRANKAAEEIMSSSISGVTVTRHLLEERNLVDLKDNDDENEEALYSAVVREEETPKPAFAFRNKTSVRSQCFRSMVSEGFIKAKSQVPAPAPANLPLQPETRLLKELTIDQQKHNYYPIHQQSQQQFYQMPPGQMYGHQPFMQGQGFYDPSQMMAYYQANGYGYMMPQGFPNGTIRR